jgi:hypothetical protein
MKVTTNEKNKKPFYKRIWFWTIIVLIFVFYGIGAYQNAVEESKENINELKEVFSSSGEDKKENINDEQNKKQEQTKDNNEEKQSNNLSEANNYTEDQKAAKYTMQEIIEKYPVGSSFNDYSTDILGNITMLESVALKNKDLFDLLIAKDGFIGIESDGDTIIAITQFSTYQEAKDFIESNKQ